MFRNDIRVSKAEKNRIIMEAAKKAQKRHIFCNLDTLRKQRRIESVVRPPRMPQNDMLDGNAEYGSQLHVELNSTSQSVGLSTNEDDANPCYLTTMRIVG